MKRLLFSLITIVVLALSGCESEEALKPSPTFISEDKTMIGIEGNIGILGSGFIAKTPGKYMWHFWGKEEELSQSPFRVEAINVKTNKKVKTLILRAATPQNELVWEYDTSGMGGVWGRNNGADGHLPTNMVLPESGIWKLNAYLGDKLKGTIIVDVMERRTASIFPGK